MKRFFQFIGVVLLIVIAVVLIRTILTHSGQQIVSQAPDIPLEKTEVATHLSQALQYQTVSYQDTAQFQVKPFLFFHQFLEETFPLVHQYLEVSITKNLGLLYRWQGSNPDLKPILFAAHQDVVPVNPLSQEEWVYPPFSGAVEDGYIWGRGALDDKGSLLGILEAVELLLRDGFQPERTIFLAFGQDEEIGGTLGASAIAQRLKNEGIQLEFVIDEGGMITKNVVPDVKNPVALVGTAEKGYVSLRLTAHGNEGHSSMPPEFTSIGRVSQAIAELEENPFPSTLEYARPLLQTVAPEMPFLKRMIVRNLWLFSTLLENIYSQSPKLNAIIRTTTAPTIFNAGIKDNVLPGRAEAVVNFRILPGETMESVKSRVIKIIDDPHVDVTIEPFGENPSPVSSTDNPSYNTLKNTILQTMNSNTLVAPYLVLGATDSRYYASVTHNIYRFLPFAYTDEDIDRMHGTNERISIDNYVRGIQFYYQLIQNSQEISAEE